MSLLDKTLEEYQKKRGLSGTMVQVIKDFISLWSSVRGGLPRKRQPSPDPKRRKFNEYRKKRYWEKKEEKE